MAKPQNKGSELRAAVRACSGTFWAAAFFSLFINLLMLVPPLYMLQIYDRVLASRSESTLVMLTAIVVVLMVVLGALEWIRSRVLVRASGRLDSLIGDRVFDALFRRGLITPGGADSQPVQDANTVRQFLTGSGLLAFFDSPWLPIYIAVIFLFHPLLGWVALGGALILLILALANNFMSRAALNQANAEQVAAQQTLTNQLRNAEAAAAMGMVHRLRQRWQERQERVIGFQSRASDQASPFYATSRAFRLLLQSLILGTGAYLAIHQLITPGIMIAATILLGRALAPMDSLIGNWRGIMGARQAFGRLEKLLAEHPAEERKLSLPAPKGRIDAEQLTVVPPGASEPAIRAVSFTIAPGETVGVIGPSAAGKSTLVRALLGVWPPRAGHARIDGADVADYNADELGPHIGYLPQDVELFEGTVAENIARFGDVDAQAVVEAAQAAGVHELVLHLGNGYDTYLGPGGATLSGGQRQRIGLARALYGNPAILVLDEPNSNLDDSGDAALTAALDQGHDAGRTQIVISHRHAVLARVHRLFVLKEGRLLAAGDRDEVLQRFARGASATATGTSG
ncbi:type I secretion system permease/ATPase [Aquisalimonas sp. 2447]|uniref:type I secretion system permease/ATPase n=1 Tax=Aquisalimonas sp. 2447 TaxID=2740807 RepID=UPI0020C22FFD|nr:type I secretion system permease/ATPase [Aquisalimonas sp. 2447]